MADMVTRKPLVAGRFYPASAAECRETLEALLREAGEGLECPGRLCGGIVPHAGWMCSGAVAAKVFFALAEQSSPNTVVLLGAVHRWSGRAPAMYDAGAWETPLGEVEVDADLAAYVAGRCRGLKVEPLAHAQEHSLEVQMPMVKHFWPSSEVLPIMVPPAEDSADFGRELGAALEDVEAGTLVVGTTDLTHYGPGYGFEPAGPGTAGLRWAKEVNDCRMIELISRLDAEAVVAEARERHNACGSGAVASTLAAVVARGAERTVVLEHTTSHEVLGGSGRDAVGYVGAVFAAGSSSRRVP